uniref:rRNA biogenesis protein RRP36 n=1 Tax=Periophthalmus magnuspinnatus TaxID=409849 RepID=A0A3B4AWX7_9GOBI
IQTDEGRMKKKVKCPVKRPASSDEDSDMERNFTLFERQETKTDDQHERREEEEESAEEGEESTADEEDDPEEGEDFDDSIFVSFYSELSHMSFEDVLKLQNKVGTKVYNKVKHNSCSGPEPSEKRKRLNKNRPMEVSAKRPVQFLRQVVSAKKSTLRDPRFDDLSGEYKADIFEKTYSFINDIKLREKEKKLKKAKSERKKEKLQFLVKRMENQERARLSHEHQRNRELELKRKQRERALPQELKKLQLLEKYQDLKRSGKLENFLTKKRKRNAAKDRRKLPPKQHSNAPRGFHGPH